MSQVNFAEVSKIAAAREGMMLSESVAIWHAVLKMQRATWAWQGLGPGAYLEIGVFKGKSASVLALHAQAYHNDLVLIDPVIDEETKATLAAIYPAVEFHEMRSELLRISDLYRRRFRDCAFIHIDGMHTFSVVSEDLRCAEDMLADFGIVCIDDFHTDLYPQIPAAVYRHLYGGTDLSLFLVGFNKAYLCRNAAKRNFHAYVRDDIVHSLKEVGFNLTLVKTDRHDSFDAFALTYADPSVAGDPYR